MWAIVIPSIWRGLPFAMIFFLAGLQAMPQELHEAAAIDGAGPLRRFRYITLPLLRPLIAVQLLFCVIYASYQFAIPYIMLGSNPGPDADLMMTLIVRQSFSNNLFGFGAAASVLLMLAMCVWVAVWYRAFKRDSGGHMSPRSRCNRGLDALTWLVLLVMLSPILWLIAASLQTDGQLSSGAYDLLEPTFTAFSRMWKTVDFERYLINSLIICTAAALLATAFAACAGYALARFRFRGATALSLGVVGTQLIPGSLFLLPVFMGFVWLKQNTPIALFDTHVGMVLVYTAFFTPVAIYFMRYFFVAIPRDLEEAAMVDGCNRFGAFVKIVLPAAAPGPGRDVRLRLPVRVGRAAVRRRPDAGERRDDPDRHPQLHR